MVELWGRRMRLRTPWMVNWIMESVEVPSLSLLHLRVAPQQTYSMGKCLWISLKLFSIHPGLQLFCLVFFQEIRDLWLTPRYEKMQSVMVSAPESKTSSGPGTIQPGSLVSMWWQNLAPKKSNELIPKFAVVKGSRYLFQSIILGIYVSFLGVYIFEWYAAWQRYWFMNIYDIGKR